VATVSAIPVWQRALIVLTSTVVGVVVVGCLYWAQTVLIPVALAVFLTFLLTPLVSLLQQRGLRRTPAVVLVVLLAGLVLGGTVWLVTGEVRSVAGDLPEYTDNIKEKIKSVQQMGEETEGLGKMIQAITAQWNLQPAIPKDADADKPATPATTPAEKPATVILQPESPAWLSRLPALLGTAAEVLGGLGLALVLVVFMLLKRENLRDHLIRLAGHGRMTMLTKALDDAGQRISRFLLMQLFINAGFGLVLTLGLLAVQVPHALLWGFLAAVLRYVPYLGSWITAILLFTLSLGVFPGWVQPLLVLGSIVGLELAVANLVEPRLFGRSIGVSEVALLVAAAFWAFLWGPIGLVLSSPLTVCLVVLGKHVPQLGFLDVLLGDETSLDVHVSYYQRLLARDQDEAAQLVLAQAKTSPVEEVYDALLVPTLNFVKRDRERDDLTEADEKYIVRATREIVEDLGERQAAAATAKVARAPVVDASDAPAPNKIRILGCPGHDEADVLALDMLRQLLDPARWEVDVLSLDMLSAEMVALARAKNPRVVCIGAVPPGGLAHTRYLCKRLRAGLPDARIVVGRWGLRADVEQNREQLLEAGADQVETTLLEMRTHLHEWLPVLDQGAGKATLAEQARRERLVAV
jgi:predicted PurR-regulated permease PerM/cell division inhibitor SulA